MLLDPHWWRDVAARAGRQAVQVLIPARALAAAGDVAGVDPAATALAVALAVLVSLVKAVAGITFGSSAPRWQQALERAAAAAAGAVAALLPADGLGLLTLDWGDLGLAAAGAAGLALAAMVTNPPEPTVYV
jgi:hypothetical protein